MASVCDCGPPPVFDLPPPPDPGDFLPAVLFDRHGDDGGGEWSGALAELRSSCEASERIGPACAAPFLSRSSPNSNYSGGYDVAHPVDILPDAPWESRLQFYGTIAVAVLAAFLFAVLACLCIVAMWRRLRSVCFAPFSAAGAGAPHGAHRRGSKQAGDKKAELVNNNNQHHTQPISSWLFEPNNALRAEKGAAAATAGGHNNMWLARPTGHSNGAMGGAGDTAHYYAPNECAVPQAHSSCAGLVQHVYGGGGAPDLRFHGRQSQSAGRFRDASTNTMESRPHGNRQRQCAASPGGQSVEEAANAYYEQIPMEDCGGRAGSLVHMYNPLSGHDDAEHTGFEELSSSGGSHYPVRQAQQAPRLPAPLIAPPPPPAAGSAASDASGLGSSSMADSLEEAISMSPSPKRLAPAFDNKQRCNTAAPLADCNGRNGRESGYGTDSRKGHVSQRHRANNEPRNVWVRTSAKTPQHTSSTTAGGGLASSASNHGGQQAIPFGSPRDGGGQQTQPQQQQHAQCEQRRRHHDLCVIGARRAAHASSAREALSVWKTTP